MFLNANEIMDVKIILFSRLMLLVLSICHRVWCWGHGDGKARSLTPRHAANMQICIIV